MAGLQSWASNKDLNWLPKALPPTLLAFTRNMKTWLNCIFLENPTAFSPSTLEIPKAPRLRNQYHWSVFCGEIPIQQSWVILIYRSEIQKILKTGLRSKKILLPTKMYWKYQKHSAKGRCGSFVKNFNFGCADSIPFSCYQHRTKVWISPLAV